MLYEEKVPLRINEDRPSVLRRILRRPSDMHRQMRRSSISDILPFLSYNPKNNLIFSSDRELNPMIGALYVAPAPISFANDQLLAEMRSAISTPIGAGAFLQFLRFDVPDITGIVRDYRSARLPLEIEDDSFSMALRDLSDYFSSFLETLTDKPPFIGNSIHASESYLIFSVSTPSPETPNEKFIKDCDMQFDNTVASMTSLGLRRADPATFLKIWRRFLHYYSPWDDTLSEDRLLKDQIPSPGDGLVEMTGGIRSLIGRDEPDTIITPFSIKEFPEEHNMVLMDALMGDSTGVKSGCPDPVMWSWTARMPDQPAKRNWVKKKHATINYQAFGPAAKWVPSIMYKKRGFDNLVHMIEGKGDAILEVSLSAFIFSRDVDHAKRSAAVFQSNCQSWNFDMRVDDLIPLPVFLNALPLYPTVESTAMLHRFKTMSSTQAVSILPIFGDWKGPGNFGDLSFRGAGTPLITRRGNVTLFDIFSSNGNYNFYISGGSGAGKSTFSQGLVTDQLAIGANSWVIEIGRSFEKLCKVLGGTHLSFDENTDIRMNPFSMVVEFEDELDELTGIHATMASPNENLSAEDLTYIKESIRSVYSEKGRGASPTDVYLYLLAQPSDREKMLARMMFDYTVNGPYGHIFTGSSNIDLNHRLTVLELQDLQSRKGLQAVVLLQLMFSIQRQMYSLSASGRRNILFVDEASELLKIDSASSFMEGAYRRARKNKGAIGIGIQGVSDLFLSKTTEIIASQSEHRFLLFQEAESIQRAVAEKQLILNDYTTSLISGLRKSKGFSEMVISSCGSSGAFRYVLDPYTLAMSSTSGKARDQVLADIHNGMRVKDAIVRYLDEENPEWRLAYSKPDYS